MPCHSHSGCKGFLRDCRKFLIIGTSGLDDDLLMLLDDLVPTDKQSFLHLVDMGEGATKTLERFNKGVRAFVRPYQVQSLFDMGFQKYLATRQISEFTEWHPSPE